MGLRTLAVVFALKYLAQATLWFRPYDRLAAGDLGSAYLIVLVTVTAGAWLAAAVRPSPVLLSGGFVLVAVDAALKAEAQGPYFYNHFVLEVVVGILGLLAIARARRTDAATEAWRPMAILAIGVWGIAAVKKLLLGTYLTGEYLASLASSARPTPLRDLVRHFVVSPDGVYDVPQQCCSAGRVTLGLVPALIVVALGLALLLAEFLPVVLVALRVQPQLIGVALLSLTTVATAGALEFDFGLTNLALASFWSGPRTRWFVIAAAALFAIGVAV